MSRNLLGSRRSRGALGLAIALACALGLGDRAGSRVGLSALVRARWRERIGKSALARARWREITHRDHDARFEAGDALFEAGVD